MCEEPKHRQHVRRWKRSWGHAEEFSSILRAMENHCRASCEGGRHKVYVLGRALAAVWRGLGAH